MSVMEAVTWELLISLIVACVFITIELWGCSLLT